MLFAYSSRDGVENRDKVYCSQVHYYILRGEVIVRLLKGAFSYRTYYRLRSY